MTQLRPDVSWIWLNNECTKHVAGGCYRRPTLIVLESAHRQGMLCLYFGAAAHPHRVTLWCDFTFLMARVSRQIMMYLALVVPDVPPFDSSLHPHSWRHLSAPFSAVCEVAAADKNGRIFNNHSGQQQFTDFVFFQFSFYRYTVSRSHLARLQLQFQLESRQANRKFKCRMSSLAATVAQVKLDVAQHSKPSS